MAVTILLLEIQVITMLTLSTSLKTFSKAAYSMMGMKWSSIQTLNMNGRRR